MTDADGMGEPRQVIEAHCRRCGSHLGHVLHVENDILHCINGASLTFAADDAA
jgi:peptide-methionine (R)-S-oxide reductase